MANNENLSERILVGKLQRLQSEIYKKNIPEIKRIIENDPGIIDKKVRGLNGVLTAAILSSAPPNLIQILIDYGAPLNTCDGSWDFRGPPLVWSLIRNVGESPDFETARLLINNGADINYHGDNCSTPLEAIIKDDVGAKDGSYHADQVGIKKKILNFLFNVRDSEGRRVEVDCQYKDNDGLTIFELARKNGGPAFEAFLIEKCNASAGRNITAAKAAWNGNKSGSSLYGRMPEEVLMGPIAQFLGGPKGPLKPDGTHAYPHPNSVVSALRGVKTDPRLAKLQTWARGVREGRSRARATNAAASGLLSLSKLPYYTRNNGKTVRYLSQREPKGGRRRRTRRRR